MSQSYVCTRCETRHVWGKGVDKSEPSERYKNPVDKLTSPISWSTAWSKYCYFCDKKHTGLIKS